MRMLAKVGGCKAVFLAAAGCFLAAAGVFLGKQALATLARYTCVCWLKLAKCRLQGSVFGGFLCFYHKTTERESRLQGCFWVNNDIAVGVLANIK